MMARTLNDAHYLLDSAIITMPAYFNHNQIEATRQAGELAGYEVVELLHEPTAAAIYYSWVENHGDAMYLVYDLGGGTFDVSIIRRRLRRLRGAERQRRSLPRRRRLRPPAGVAPDRTRRRGRSRSARSENAAWKRSIPRCSTALRSCPRQRGRVALRPAGPRRGGDQDRTDRRRARRALRPRL